MIKDSTSLHILIVEDNPGDQLIVEEYLKDHLTRHKITSSATYGEAEELLKDGSNSFDVILLDLTLPDISKETLIARTAEMVDGIPVIILTGYADLDFAVKSLSVGMSDYLIKDTITPLVIYKSIIYAIERQRFIMSLKASEKRYMDIFHLSPEPMWLYEAKTYRFLDVNNAAINRYGYSKDEFLQMTLADIRPREDVPLFHEAVKTVNHASVGGEIEDGPFRHQKKDGTIIFVDIRFNFIDFRGSRAVIILATNVTERVMRMRAIEMQNKKLKDIAWTQSHVVRAPLSRLKSIVDMLHSSVPLDEDERNRLLNSIRDSADELDIITKDIVRKSRAALANSETAEKQGGEHGL